MDQVVLNFVERVREAENHAALRDLFSRALDQMGFTQFTYLLMSMPGREGKRPLFISTYHDEWIVRYKDKAYVDIDPVAIQANQDILPFKWGTPTDLKSASKEQKAIFNEASVFDVKAGFTVPIHARGHEFAAISVATNEQSPEFPRLIERYGHQLHLMAIHFHAAARRFESIGDSLLKKVTLTPREIECLTWAAAGKSAWETAEILSIAESTVVSHVKNVRRKFGVPTTAQAIVKALTHGAILP